MKKYYILLSLFPLLLLANFSHATPIGINILTENHHIWGEAGINGSYPWNTYYYNSYELTSNQHQPLHYRVEGMSESTWLPDVAESWAGDFRTETFTNYWTGYAIAESTYTFQPEYDHLTIDVTAFDNSTHQGPVIWYSLTNNSTGEQLLYNLYDWNNHDAWEEWPSYELLDTNEHYEIAVNSENIYELQLYVNGWGGDSDATTFLHWDMTSAPIPEPTTILLLCAGFVGLFGVMKKKK